MGKDFRLGDRDEDGFCDLYVDGKKSDTRLLVFTEEESEKLLKMVDKVYDDLEPIPEKLTFFQKLIGAFKNRRY